jgi:hypothetical protein
VKPVLNNLAIIIKWYLQYKGLKNFLTVREQEVQGIDGSSSEEKLIISETEKLKDKSRQSYTGHQVKDFNCGLKNFQV